MKVISSLLLAATLGAAATPHPAVIGSEWINPDAPYPECHASTIVEAAPGRLVAAWFGGTKERNPDVSIYVAQHDGTHWLPGVKVADGVQADGSPRLPTWNPVLFAPKDAPLHLFYKIGPDPSSWWGMVTTSGDHGKTWSAPSRLPAGILGPIKNKPVILPDGTWLSPTSTEGTGGWQVHFERSNDGGKTWEKTPPLKKGPSFGAIQPSILFHKDGQLQALCRSQQGVVVQTWSKDSGRTWSALTATALPNPNSGTDAITLADGRQLIVYNHSGHRPEEAKGDRWPLDVAISNNGLAWNRVVTLETDPCNAGYAYPAVIQTADGKVHITYTHNRQKIKHVVIDPAKL